jgi:stage II sporulation protein R
MQEMMWMAKLAEKVDKRVAIAAMMAVSLWTTGFAVQAAKVEPVETKAIVADDEANGIPEGAIRLRIIANSDRPEDQQLKRDIRDEVIKAVGAELRGTKDENEAREKISQAVPKMNEIAARVIQEKGYSYSVKTDYGMVPFPTKMYGDKVYPAGEYEALRIQIGAAEGQNWWCVLFPPLCFVDMANGDAVQSAPKDMEATKVAATIEVTDAATGEEKEVQVRSKLVDKISEWWNELFA